MSQDVDTRLLENIQERILWLSVKMIEHANHERKNVDGIKVGGHQASCASMVTLMTALYLHHLRADDFVAVKPHGSPVLHAIQYLLGNRTQDELRSLRALGGLQAYPTRTKDADVDFTTGSVGLGPAATLFAATTRRYVDSHFGPRENSRFFAVLGDAELDEGNVWEAVHDPGAGSFGNVTWLVDFNRQSLDRIVPDMRLSPWEGAFTAHGWQVRELKYGRRLQAFASERDADAVIKHIDSMPNELYQSLFSLHGNELRARFLQGADPAVERLLEDVNDDTFRSLVTDLGGHDLEAVVELLGDSDPDRPTVVFAYTHKGWGLPIQGNARNHAAVLSSQQVDELRGSLGIDPDHEWDAFPADSPEGQLLHRVADRLRRAPASTSEQPDVPVSTGLRLERASSTQEAFGRLLTELGRDERTAPYVVTTSPDVATSTNLAGWINKVGVFSPHERESWSDDPVLRWLESPSGQHIELGISEMNLFLLLGQLGLADAYHGQKLLPVGTLYDPFVCRGLDALIYSVYSGSSFVVAGTPSGISLAPEGGAHQSTLTASIGTELPGVEYHEPAFGRALDWLLCDALRRVAEADGSSSRSAYFRLSTRPLNQSPFFSAMAETGEEELHRQVLQGSYRLRTLGEGEDSVSLVGCGAVMPEVLDAADELADEGLRVHVYDIPSPRRLYGQWSHARRISIGTARPLVMPEAMRRLGTSPLVTVQDASSHSLAWLGSALGVKSLSLGVDAFGESGTIPDLYRVHQLDAGSIANAAVCLLYAGAR